MDEEEVEVSFCDLCGTSVPAADIASGHAVVHQGKTIGRCCLEVLNGGGGDEARGASAARSVAARSMAADGSRAATFGVVLLVALVGSLIFLDGRISSFETAAKQAQGQIALAQQQQGQLLSGLGVALDGKAGQEAVAALQQDCQALLTQLMAAAERDAQRPRALVHDARVEVRAERRRGDAVSAVRAEERRLRGGVLGEELSARLVAQRAREDEVRRRSQEYGEAWCARHAADAGLAVADWRAGEDTARTRVEVRVYDREARAMRVATLAEVLDVLPPELPRATAFGQLALTPTLHVSLLIGHVLAAARKL